MQALNTGHAGSLSTIHANSAEQALARFASCVVQSGVELPYQAVRYQIAEAIDLVLHLGRHRGARHVEELIHVEGYDVGRDGYDHRHEEGGRGPDQPPDPPRRPIGGPPLPVATPARVRLREPARLADLRPRPRRRAPREPAQPETRPANPRAT